MSKFDKPPLSLKDYAISIDMALTPSQERIVASKLNEETGEYEFNQRGLPAAHKWCRDVVEDWMTDNDAKIVVANTFTQEWEMKDYYELAAKYGYRVHSLIVENRHGNESIHNVPTASIGNMLHRFQIKL